MTTEASTTWLYQSWQATAVAVFLLGSADTAMAAQTLGGLPPSPAMNAVPAIGANITVPVKSPNKPDNLIAQQSSVSWKIPDQDNGRTIQQWLVRVCPKVEGNPNAACQQITVLDGPNGRFSGTTVQVQIPAHVMFMGVDKPVSGAEICAKNSVGVSCADRITLSTSAVKSSPGFGSALLPKDNSPGKPGIAGPAKSGTEQGGFAVSAGRASAAISTARKLSEPIVITASMLQLKVTAPPPVQDIAINAVPLHLKVSMIAAPSDITISAAPLRLSVKQDLTSGKFSMASTKIALSNGGIVMDTAPLRLKVLDAPTVKPIVVDASPLSLKASMIPQPTSIAVSTSALKLTVSSPH